MDLELLDGDKRVHVIILPRPINFSASRPARDAAGAPAAREASWAQRAILGVARKAALWLASVGGLGTRRGWVAAVVAPWETEPRGGPPPQPRDK